MTTRTARMEKRINETFKPVSLNIIDESQKHAGHAAMKGLEAKETHFRLEIVSDDFDGKTLIQRHRLVQDALKDEFDSGLHALSLKLKTESEFFWDEIDLTNITENSTFILEKLKKVNVLRGVANYCYLNKLQINDFLSHCNENLEALDVVSTTSNVKLNSTLRFKNLNTLSINHDNLFKIDFESLNITQIHIFNKSNKSVDQLDILQDSLTLKFVNLYYYKDIEIKLIEILSKISTFSMLNLYFCNFNFEEHSVENVSTFSYSELNKKMINELKYIKNGLNLENLKIPSWHHDPDGICFQIKKVPNLKSIDLSNSNVTDEGLANILKIKQLKNLNLENCQHVSSSSILKLLEKLKIEQINLKKCKQISEGEIQFFECFNIDIQHAFIYDQKNEEIFKQSIQEIWFKDWNKYLKKIKSHEITEIHHFIAGNHKFKYQFGNSTYHLSVPTKDANKLMKMLKKSSVRVIKEMEFEKEIEDDVEKIEKFVSFQLSNNTLEFFSSEDFIPMNKDTTKLLKMKPGKSILK
eukprot:gene3081-5251_t